MLVFQVSKQQNRTQTTSSTVLGIPPNRARTKRSPLEKLSGNCRLSWVSFVTVTAWNRTRNRTRTPPDPFSLLGRRQNTPGNTPENAGTRPFRESATSGVLHFVFFGAPLKENKEHPKMPHTRKRHILGTVSYLRFRVCCIFGFSSDFPDLHLVSRKYRRDAPLAEGSHT